MAKNGKKVGGWKGSATVLLGKGTFQRGRGGFREAQQEGLKKKKKQANQTVCSDFRIKYFQLAFYINVEFLLIYLVG